MAQADQMQKIQSLQIKIGMYLSRLVPVPWNKVCLYAECAPEGVTIWYAAEEQETKAVCTKEHFWERYDSYPADRETVEKLLTALADALHKAYQPVLDQQEMWCTMYYSITADDSVHMDLGREMPEGTREEITHAVYAHFFGAPYQSVTGKYPSAE
ncbi:MAG: hypothetical protein K5705_04070 [Oscillospiraceae bacterium]|nr:hypothetical protein [Oscillospiraceae bacterium]